MADGLREAVPRIYQVTPDIPDRRRATKQKEVRPLPGRQPQRESARRRSGTSLQRRTSPTSRITTASLEGAARLAAPAAARVVSVHPLIEEASMFRTSRTYRRG